jgi:ABC-2 type transport system permease protein
MHVRKYVGTMRAELRNMRAYQLDFLSSIIYLPVEMGVVYFLWFVIYSYSGLTAIGGLSFGDIVVYFLMLRIAGRIVGRGDVLREVGEDIRKGNLSVYLCRPVDYPTYKLFSALSYVTVNMLAGLALFVVVSASLSL